MKTLKWFGVGDEIPSGSQITDHIRDAHLGAQVLYEVPLDGPPTDGIYVTRETWDEAVKEILSAGVALHGTGLLSEALGIPRRGT